MAFVVAEPCINVKDKSCVEVCPVDCIYDEGDQFYIHPDECIDCGACVPACPVSKISQLEELPDKWANFAEKNRQFFENKP